MWPIKKAMIRATTLTTPLVESTKLIRFVTISRRRNVDHHIRLYNERNLLKWVQ